MRSKKQTNRFKVLMALVIALAIFGTAMTAFAGLLAVGPTDPAGGFPFWYQDKSTPAITLQLCPAADPMCVSAPVVPANAFSTTIGFGEEGFWYLADGSFSFNGGSITAIFATEAAFVNAPGGEPADGFQDAFNRIRIRVTVPVAGTYTITHPFGTDIFNVPSVGPGNEINVSEDVGCFGIGLPRACDFTIPLSTASRFSNFLKWDTGAPAGYIGNPATPHAVVGSPTGNNFIRIQGPALSNLDGLGGTTVTNTLFLVSGKLFANKFDSSPALKDFGTLIGGTASAAQTFTLTNVGTANLTITGITLGGANADHFAAVTGTCAVSGVITPNATCTVITNFAPPALSNGAKTATITVTATDAGAAAPNLVINLTGIADSTPPTVASHIPADNAVNVPVNSKITVVFSEPMLGTDITAANFTLLNPSQQAVAGTVSFDTVNKVATFLAPNNDLQFEGVFTATISAGVKDLIGNGMAANHTWTFTTTKAPDITPPQVTASSPATSAIGVLTNAIITVTFDEAMDSATINSGTFLVNKESGGIGGLVTYNTVTKTASFTPLTALTANTTYTGIISTGAKDLAANAMASNFVFSFTTVDTVPPTVTSVTPLNAATKVSVANALTAVFSETMDAATITASTFILNSSTGAVAGTVSFDATTKTATFTPSASLESNTTYTATVTTGVKDAPGNAMASSFSWSFTTADVVPPTVTGVSPASGQAGVALNTTITAVFSEAMDTASLNVTTFTLTDGVTPVTGLVTWDSTTNAARLSPTANLSGSTTYTATVSTGAKDASGNAMTAVFSWSFTTGVTADTTAPAVTSTSPSDGATGVALNTTISAVFSETMSEASIGAASFVLMTGASVAVPGTVAFEPITKMAVFTPLGKLTPNVTYIATITTAVRDGAGNAMSANKSWTFSVAAGSALTINKGGTGSGTITSAPAGINCGSDCNETFEGGTSVTLTAAADSGSKFGGWSGGGCSGTGTCSVTLNQDTTISALFVPSTQVVLQVNMSGNGSGSVTIKPAAAASCGDNCFIFNVPAGTAKKVAITAKPAPGVVFAGWSGDATGAARVLSITLQQTDKKVTARFGEPRIAFSSQELKFGSVVRRAIGTQSLTISNVGDAPLKITRITKAGAGAGFFTIIKKSNNKALLTATIAEGASLEAIVRFKPLTLGTKNVTLRIASNDSHSPVTNVKVSGTGIKKPVSATSKKFIEYSSIDYLTTGEMAGLIAAALQSEVSEVEDTYNLASKGLMAELIVAALDGKPADGPGECEGGYSAYDDVSSDNRYCKHINRLFELGITSECGPEYCPESPVTAEQLSEVLEQVKNSMEAQN